MSDPENHSILPCFKCGSKLKLDPGTESLINAMTFMSHGGWRSSLYDPIDSRRFLRIHLCDACVAAAAKQGLVLEGTRIPVPEVKYEKWTPPS